MLIDDILDGFASGTHDGLLRRFPWLHLDLQRAAVYGIDAVAGYLDSIEDERTRQRPFDVTRELPNVAPLAPLTWLEWRPKGPDVASLLPACGVLVRVAHDSVADERPLPWSNDDSRWGLMLYFLWPLASGDWSLAYASLCLGVDEHGTVRNYSFYDLGKEAWCEERETAWPLWAPAYVALTAVCFAHCKGVTTTERQQPRQQRRAAERAGRPPLVTYKTIDIAPVTRILREEGQVEKTGIKRALHITRGHFAHYTEDAPLFGKYTGTFYRPMHVRGTLERGAVIKDYRVLPGDDQVRPS